MGKKSKSKSILIGNGEGAGRGSAGAQEGEGTVPEIYRGWFFLHFQLSNVAEKMEMKLCRQFQLLMYCTILQAPKTP